MQAKDLADPKGAESRDRYDDRALPVPVASDLLVPDGRQGGCVDNGLDPSTLDAKDEREEHWLFLKCYSRPVVM